jgi:ketosteroid isomerase-like protein
MDALLDANAAFYRAFESLSLARMEEVWLRAAHITCIHPGWNALVGWGPVMEGWEGIFASAFAMKFTLDDVRCVQRGDVGWVVLVEHVESHDRDGKSLGVVQATNVFERHEGRWLIVHHHGSPVYPPLAGRGPAMH